MKFSERWLRTMVDPALDTAGLCDRLTMAGLEVESADSAAPPFSGVIVAQIDQVDAQRRRAHGILIRCQFRRANAQFALDFFHRLARLVWHHRADVRRNAIDE